MVASQTAVKLTAGPQDVADLQWWHELAAHAGSLDLSRVNAAEARGGTIVQSNCVIRRYLLTVNATDQISVVVKQVDLSQNSYRDEEHMTRSRRSYQVERAFYDHVAPLLRDRGLPLPGMLGSAWTADCMQGVTILEDLASPPGNPAAAERCAEHGRSPLQRLSLDEADSRRALSWLAAFHAACWVSPGEPAGSNAIENLAQEHLWPHGGYWTLEKRRAELARMQSQWSRWQAAMLPESDSDAGVAGLALRLRSAAGALHARLAALCAASGRTVLHGDFKTANLFFRAAGPGGVVRACPCDFQWVGMGSCMQDVVYLLWSSVEPEVVATREAELVAFYREELRRGLAAAGVSRAPSDCELHEQYEAAFLDYVRFLIGSMWGSCTAESFAAKAGDINQGMHKRNRPHQMRMVERAVRLLGQHSTLHV